MTTSWALEDASVASGGTFARTGGTDFQLVPTTGTATPTSAQAFAGSKSLNVESSPTIAVRKDNGTSGLDLSPAKAFSFMARISGGAGGTGVGQFANTSSGGWWWSWVTFYRNATGTGEGLLISAYIDGFGGATLAVSDLNYNWQNQWIKVTVYTSPTHGNVTDVFVWDAASGYTGSPTMTLSVPPSVYDAWGNPVGTPLETAFADGGSAGNLYVDSVSVENVAASSSSTAPLDLALSLTASGVASYSGTASADVALALTAEGTTENFADASLDVAVTLTADGVITGAPGSWTADSALDVSVSLDAEGTVSRAADASLDVAFALTAEASTTSDAHPTWGSPETWGDLWGWWTVTPDESVVPVGFALTAEGAAVAPQESTASLDVAISLTADGTAERSESSSLDVSFSLAAEGIAVDGALNPASLDVGVALDAVGFVTMTTTSGVGATFVLSATGVVTNPGAPPAVTRVPRPGAYATFRYGARRTL